MRRYTVKLLAVAEKEVTEACEWYNERQAGLGKRLLSEVNSYLTKIAENPLKFNVRFSEVYRCVPLKIFPYLIVYRIEEESKSVIVISVFHTSRNPHLF